MGIFNIFKKDGNTEDNKIPQNWSFLIEESQLEEIKKESHENTILIFKHSTKCSISHQVLKRFQSKNTGNSRVYYLDLLNYRSISSKISEVFGVEHQSPQLLIIKEGNCQEHASHSDILSVEI